MSSRPSDTCYRELAIAWPLPTDKPAAIGVAEIALALNRHRAELRDILGKKLPTDHRHEWLGRATSRIVTNSQHQDGCLKIGVCIEGGEAETDLITSLRPLLETVFREKSFVVSFIQEKKKQEATPLEQQLALTL